MVILWETKEVDDFERIRIDWCDGYIEDTTEAFHSDGEAIKIVITDQQGETTSRSHLGIGKDVTEFNDPAFYPDLYLSCWRMIPSQPFWFSSPKLHMNIARLWEWWRDAVGDAYNFRTGCLIQSRDSATRRFYTMGVTFEEKVPGVISTVVPFADLWKPWNFGEWFRLQYHIHRDEDQRKGYIEGWINDTLVVPKSFTRTAFNSLYASSVLLEFRIINYVSRVPPESRGHIVTAFADDIVVSTEYVPLDYVVGGIFEPQPSPEPKPKTFAAEMLPIPILLNKLWKMRQKVFTEEQHKKLHPLI